LELGAINHIIPLLFNREFEMKGWLIFSLTFLLFFGNYGLGGKSTPGSFLYRPQQAALAAQALRDGKYPHYSAELTATISTLNSTNKNVVLDVTNNQILRNNVTINSNITLKVHRGAVITVHNGCTLKINGTIEAGPYQIFNPPSAPTIKAVRDDKHSSPPTPADGIRYIVKPVGTGIWAGHDNQPAEFNFSPIEGLSRAKQCVVTQKRHGRLNGEHVYFTGITQSGWTRLNNHYYAITIIDPDTFSIYVDSSRFATDYNPVFDPGTLGLWTFTPLSLNMVVCVNNVSYKWNGGSWIALGRVELGHGVTPQALIRWWGAVGDGTTNDTAAVQAAINAVCAYTSGTLQGCMGDVYLVDALHIPSVSNRSGTTTLDGNGATLLQKGADNILNFGFRSNHRFIVERWRFQGKSANIWSKSPLGLGGAPTQVDFNGTLGASVKSVEQIRSTKQWYYEPTTDTLYIHNNPAAPALPSGITVIKHNRVSLTGWTKWYGGVALNINDPGGVSTTVRDCVIFHFNKALEFGYGIDCQIENINIIGCNYAAFGKRNIGQSRGVYFKAVNMSYIYSNDAAIYWEDAMGLELRHCCLQIYAGRAVNLNGVNNVLIDVLDTEGSCYGGKVDEAFLFKKCRNIDVRNSSLTLGSDFNTEMCSAMFNMTNTTGGVSIKNNNISITDRTVPTAIYRTDLTVGYIDISENTINGSHANADGHPVADMRRNNYQTFSLVSLEDNLLQARDGKKLTNWATVNPTFASSFTPIYTGCTGSNPDNTTGYDDSFSWKINWANATDKAYYPGCLTYPENGLWYGVLSFRYKGNAPHMVGVSLANYGAANYLAIPGDGKWRYCALIGNIPKNMADSRKPDGIQFFAKGGDYPATAWIDCISVRWFATLSEACAWIGAFENNKKLRSENRGE